MKTSLVLLLVPFFCCSPVFAGNAAEGDRELAVELGYTDLEMSSVGTFDYGSASGGIGRPI